MVGRPDEELSLPFIYTCPQALSTCKRASGRTIAGARYSRRRFPAPGSTSSTGLRSSNRGPVAAREEKSRSKALSVFGSARRARNRTRRISTSPSAPAGSACAKRRPPAAAPSPLSRSRRGRTCERRRPSGRPPSAPARCRRFRRRCKHPRRRPRLDERLPLYLRPSVASRRLLHSAVPRLAREHDRASPGIVLPSAATLPGVA